MMLHALRWDTRYYAGLGHSITTRLDETDFDKEIIWNKDDILDGENGKDLLLTSGNYYILLGVDSIQKGNYFSNDYQEIVRLSKILSDDFIDLTEKCSSVKYMITAKDCSGLTPFEFDRQKLVLLRKANLISYQEFESQFFINGQLPAQNEKWLERQKEIYTRKKKEALESYEKNKEFYTSKPEFSQELPPNTFLG